MNGQSGIRVPLSLVQEQMWDLERLAPNAGFYNEVLRHRFRGVGADAIEDALSRLVARHESLRTVFPTHAGWPYQSIAARCDVHLPVTDLRGLPPQERERTARCTVDAESARPFDVAKEPLFRARLLVLDDETTELCVVFDHLIVDATSIAILESELDELLAPRPAGGRPALAHHDIDYADFAVWQRAWLTDERIRDHEQFWIGRLRGIAPNPPAPYAAEPGRVPTPVDLVAEPAVRAFVLPDDAVRELRRRTRSAPFVLAAAAVAALVGRSTRAPDALILTSVSGRDRPEIDPVVGLFGGSSVLRVVLDDDPPFEVVLRRARAAMLGAMEHQHVPLARVAPALRAAGIELSPLAIPVAAHFFHAAHRRWAPGTSVVARPPEREGVVVPARPEASKPLEFRFYDDGATLWGELLHHRDRYDEDTAATVVGDLKGILAAAASDPLVRLSRLHSSAPAAVA